jgi:hypothetical protein
MKTNKCACCSGDGATYVDRYHRLSPLFGKCYGDPVKAKATASEPNDPSSWWSRSDLKKWEKTS